MNCTLSKVMVALFLTFMKFRLHTKLQPTKFVHSKNILPLESPAYIYPSINTLVVKNIKQRIL